MYMYIYMESSPQEDGVDNFIGPCLFVFIMFIFICFNLLPLKYML